MIALTILEAVLQCRPTSFVIDFVGFFVMQCRTAATARGVLCGGFLFFLGLGWGPLPASIRRRTRKMVALVVPTVSMMAFGAAPARKSTTMACRFCSAISRLVRLTFVLCYCFEAGILTVILM